MTTVIKGIVTDIQIIKIKHIDDYSGAHSEVQNAVLLILTNNGIWKCQYGKDQWTSYLTNAECEKFRKEIFKNFSINDNVITVGDYETGYFIFDAFYNKTKDRLKYKEKASSIIFILVFLFKATALMILFCLFTDVLCFEIQGVLIYIFFIIFLGYGFVASIANNKRTNNINTILLKEFNEEKIDKDNNDIPLKEIEIEKDG